MVEVSDGTALFELILDVLGSLLSGMILSHSSSFFLSFLISPNQNRYP